MSSRSSLAVFHGGELSAEVAKRIRQRDTCQAVAVHLHTLDAFESWASDARLGEGGRSHAAVLIVTTIEDEQPDAQSAACLRFLRRKSHGTTLLDGLNFAVLGLGDSNNLATTWRRVDWATPRDVNQAAQNVDAWLAHLGGKRFHALGESDDRTDNLPIESWIEGMWQSFLSMCRSDGEVSAQ